MFLDEDNVMIMMNQTLYQSCVENIYQTVVQIDDLLGIKLP